MEKLNKKNAKKRLILESEDKGQDESQKENIPIEKRKLYEFELCTTKECFKMRIENAVNGCKTKYAC